MADLINNPDELEFGLQPLAPADDSEQSHSVGPTRTWQETLTIGVYFAILIFLLEMRGINFEPIQKYLKEDLNLPPTGQSSAILIIAIPTFLAFAFGAIRDRWRPFGLQDRGLLLIACPVIAVVNLFIACQPLTYWNLVIGVICSGCGFMLVYAAIQGQMGDVSHRQQLSGLLATISQAFAAIAATAFSYIAGILAQQSNHHVVFSIMAALSLLVLAFGMVKPRGVYEEPQKKEAVDWRGLFKERTIWVALAVWTAWSFAPAAQTPLLNYSTNVLHLDYKQFGTIVAVQSISFFPTLALFGFLSRHMKLSTLLWIGTVIGITQFIPFLFVHSYVGAIIWAGIYMGLAGGIATGAYYDLVIRACPRGLTGIGLTCAYALAVIATRFSDLWGAQLYERSGFLICVLATIAVYSSILLLILLVPRRLIATNPGSAAN